MPYRKWRRYRDYADWRLGIRSADDINGEVDDFG